MALHLITGGNGYVGSFLARKLLSLGEKVRIIDVHDAEDRNPEIDYRNLSVLDFEGMILAMEGVDYVHHTAALVPLRKAGDDFWELNVEGTRITLEAAKRAGVKHFAHMSSSAIFGSLSESDCPITEKTKLKAVEIYGRSKLAGDDIVRAEIDKADGLSCSTIRPRTIMVQNVSEFSKSSTNGLARVEPSMSLVMGQIFFNLSTLTI